MISAFVRRPIATTLLAIGLALDGVNGYLCAAPEPESLASAMRCLVALPTAERAAMGEAGRRQVQERFSQEFVVRAYLDVLTRVTAQPEN